MEFDALLKLGMKGEKTSPVTEQNTAAALGSGGLMVYATPAMVALMEGACVAAVDSALPDGFSTVGTALDITHSAATPLGMTVRGVGELTGIEGRGLLFRVEAFDGSGKIGEGIHKRFIIEN
ncbi:MAG: thioesterase family protein, partial [Treponema sp.]|nr:thioesterase family protein [Treponema sp.]